MKKILLIAVSLMFILSGCSKKEIKEYDIETYWDLTREFKKRVEDELEHLTSTEIKNKEIEIRKEIAKELGLPYNETIRIRGKKGDVPNDYVLEVVEDIEQIAGVAFVFEDEQDFSWIDVGENILVQGYIVDTSYLALTDSKLISPEK